MKTEDPEALFSELVRRLPLCARNIEEEYPLWAAALDNLSHRSSDALCTLRQRVETAEKMAEALGVFAAHARHMPKGAPVTFTRNYECPQRIAHTFGEAFHDAEAALAAFRATGGEG